MINLQTAIFTTLDTGLSVPVRDHVPQDPKSDDDSAYPYVTIGDDRFTPFDTDNTEGYEVEIDVHVWSRARGRKQTKELQQQIYGLLHRAELSVAGYRFIGIAQTYADSAMEPDGITRHGVSRFRCLLDEV